MLGGEDADEVAVLLSSSAELGEAGNVEVEGDCREAPLCTTLQRHLLASILAWYHRDSEAPLCTTLEQLRMLVSILFPLKVKQNQIVAQKW
jgi:hypothetical protein